MIRTRETSAKVTTETAYYLLSAPVSAERFGQIARSHWAVEVTFEEVRRHLGVETQRQWSDKAIARTTPALLALFSLVTLWAHDLVGRGHLGPRCAAWYPKRHLTFSDALGAVRRELWKNGLFQTSGQCRDMVKIPAPLAQRLLDAACFPA